MAKKGELPASVQAGLPRLGSLPPGWETAPLGKYIYDVKRPIKLQPAEQYRLVTVRRNRGGADERSILYGRQIKSKTQFEIRHRDFLISKRQIAHGACAIVPEGLDGAVVSNDYSVLACQPGIDLDFLRVLSNSVYFQQTCFHSSVGVHVEKLVFKIDRWLAWEFNFPPIEEQRLIAKTIGAWDDAIAVTSKLIEAKARVKRHLLKTFINWDRWPNVPIGELVEPIARPEPTPKTAYRALGIRSHGKGTFQRTIDRPEEIDMDTVYVVGAGDLIVNITFAWEGAIALANLRDAGCFVSHRFPTFFIHEEKVARDYLGHIVRSPRFVHFLGVASPGGAGRNRVLNKRNFMKIKMPLPPIQQQRLIAEFLDGADREVEVLRQQLDAFQRQKRGLMQKLLTGEWRVPVRGSDIDAMAARVAEEAAQ